MEANFFPVFLSVVFVVRNDSARLKDVLASATRTLSAIVSDYELVVVDNASGDDSIELLRTLSREDGLPNLQVYALTKEVDFDTAAGVGLENALGDYVAVLDPIVDDVVFLPTMLDHACRGTDVVLAANDNRPSQGWAYQACFSAFNAIYEWFHGIHLGKDAPQYRLVSKRVVNFILQHPSPSMTYRHLPATGGFARVRLEYTPTRREARRKNLGDAIDRGVRLLVSTTRGPLRLVSGLSLFGAVANLVYSGYVIAVALFKADVAPGWVTLSLQQSGMFLLLSLVLLVLGEYVLQVARISNEGPAYHVAQEFTSAVMTRRQKLNVEVVRLTAREQDVARAMRAV